MIKTFTAAAFLAASLASASAWGDTYQSQPYGDPTYSRHTPYDDQENPAFTEGCPRGSIPQSFPNGNGRRCMLPNGGFSY